MPVVRFNRNAPLLSAGSAVGIEITAEASADLLEALRKDKPFPLRDIDLAGASLAAQGGKDIAFKAEHGGTVSFAASGNAFAALGIYTTADKVRAILKADEQLADGLVFESGVDRRFVVVRWGYDVKGSAKGGMALGTGGTLTFGAEASREGLFAVVQQFGAADGATTVLQRAIDCWRPPRSITGPEDLDPGTWLLSEVDGAIALSLKTTFGYDFNWVREAQLGGLSGDIGLKIQAGVGASLGFQANGRYCVVVSRESADPASRVLRLRLFRLSYKGWNFAFSAAATAQAQLDALLPASVDEFIAGVFGVKGEQIVKVLGLVDQWTDKDAKLPDLLAGLGSDYVKKLLKDLTKIDPETAFNAARAKLLDLFDTWSKLPARASSLLFTLIGEKVDLTNVRAIVKQAATADQAALHELLSGRLASADFFQRPEGRVLESLAAGPLLGAVTNSREFAAFNAAAQRLDHLLDPAGALLDVLVRLQARIDRTLKLDQLEAIVSKADFDKLDALFRQQISEFLGKTFAFEDVEKVRATIRLLREKQKAFYEKAEKALKRKYNFEFAAAWQKATTGTALIDAEFDFGQGRADLGDLWRAALAGEFHALLLDPRPDVKLNVAALVHGVTRNTHVELSLPFYKATVDHINRALGQSTVVEEEGGRVIVYELTAEDRVSTSSVLPWKKTQRDSRLTVGAFLPMATSSRSLRVHSTDAMTYTYAFSQARRRMKRADLQYQLKPLITRYFPDAFDHAASFDTWITDLDKTIDAATHNGSDNFGDTLLTLDLTLPSRVPAAWLNAPADRRAADYMDMSRSVQRSLKTLIPGDYFQDHSRYEGANAVAAALLVYASIPPSTNITFDGTRLTSNLDAEVYWDITTFDNVAAMASQSRAKAALAASVKDVHDLFESLGRRRDAEFYALDQLDTIRAAALTGIGRIRLLELLDMEREIVESSQKAGLRLAEFRRQAGRDPKEAIEALEEFGATLSSAFNKKVSSTYGGGAMRTLGTMLFLAAARELATDPEIRNVRPNGMLRLTVMKEGVQPFPPGGFPGNVELPFADVVIEQRFVTLSV